MALFDENVDRFDMTVFTTGLANIVASIKT
jgi:hypothetical protein